MGAVASSKFPSLADQSLLPIWAAAQRGAYRHRASTSLMIPASVIDAWLVIDAIDKSAALPTRRHALFDVALGSPLQLRP